MIDTYDCRIISLIGYPVLKHFLLFGILTGFSITGLAGPLWHCTANNAKGAVWNQYGETRDQTLSIAEKECIPYNDHKYCDFVCFPPRIHWRCLSHDIVPVIKDLKLGEVQPKQSTWYWTDSSKQVAINGARDACRHNSGYGGCYVDPNACASS